MNKHTISGRHVRRQLATSFLSSLIGLSVFFALGLITVKVHAAPSEVFSVSPSDDITGETDWQNIMLAFDAAQEAGYGSVVKLQPGTFYIRRPIQVTNFSGTFAGAGMDVTVITNPPGRGLEGSSAPTLPIGTPIIFIQDSTWDPTALTQDITVEHLSVTLTESPIPVGLLGDTFAFTNMIEFHGTSGSETVKINATFNSVEIDGGNIADWGVQFLNQFDFTEDTIAITYRGETLSVRNVTGWPGGFGFRNSSGVWQFNDCVFANLAESAIDMSHGDSPDLDLVVDRGIFQNTNVISSLNWNSMNRSSVQISHSAIVQPASANRAGVELIGNIDAVINNNQFHSDRAWSNLLWWTRSVVMNNRYTGTRADNIAIVYNGVESVFLGNDFHRWSGPSLYLAPESSGNTVIGQRGKVLDAIDLGTDNTLVGVNTSGIPQLGRELADGIHQRVVHSQQGR